MEKPLLQHGLQAAGLAVIALTLSACGGGLLPEQAANSASTFNSYDEVIGAYERVLPGRTREDDLPRLGFDSRTGTVDVLSYVDIESRFLPQAGIRFEQLDPAVQACIRAELHCTGYVFHPSHTGSKRMGNTVLDVLGFERVTLSEKWSADITILTLDGVVAHKLFSGSPRTQSLERKVQPLGPFQDAGAALAHFSAY